jgi:hypothetical protein
MINNKFIRNKNNIEHKFNPDILGKLENKDNERRTMKVDLSKTIYNPITNIIPQTIQKQSDLTISIDTTKIDMAKRVAEQKLARENQDMQYKPIATNFMNLSINTNIQTFDELKENTTKQKTNSNKYYSVLDNLKDLGIIK